MLLSRLCLLPYNAKFLLGRRPCFYLFSLWVLLGNTEWTNSMEVPILIAPWQKPKEMEHGGHSLGKYWHHFVFGHVLQSNGTMFCNVWRWMVDWLWCNEVWQMEWSQAQTGGTVPSPRAGHASATIGNSLYIIGGGDNKSGICNASPSFVSSICPSSCSLFHKDWFGLDWISLNISYVWYDLTPKKRRQSFMVFL